MTDSFWGNYSSGLNAINGVGQQLTARRAGGQLAAGNTRGAAATMFRAGNLEGGQAIQANAATAQTARRAEQLALTKQVIEAARRERDAGRDVAAALNSYRGAFEALGTSAEDFDAVASQVIANPALIEQFDAITQQELEWELRAGSNGDTIAVRAPDRYGNTQSRVAYAAPRDPIVTPNAVITPPNRGLAAGQQPLPNEAAPAPMAGPAISDAPLFTPQASAASVPASAMVDITAQAESGNRERDANGNLITSPAGAQGRMQVMPTTNTDPGYGVVPARDNSDAERTRVGRDYLSAMMREYGGDPAKAWAAYNWGPGNLDRALARYGGDWLAYAPAETRAYVQNNLRALNGAQGQTAQGDDSQDPLVTNVPRVETTSDGYRIERFTNPAEERAARNEERADRRETRMEERFESQEARMARDTASAVSARTFTQENQLRGQLGQNQAIKDLAAVRPQVGIIGDIAARAAAGEQISAQDDLALIFSFMKILDPGSVVREGEFANAQNTAGIPDRVVNAYNNALRGTRLSDNQRNEFFRTATRAISQYDQAALAAIERTRGTTEAYGLNPDRVAPLPSRPSQSGPSRRRRNLNEGLSEAQQRWVQQNGQPQGGRPPGTRQNPYLLNPRDPNVGWARIPSGGYFLHPDGTVRQKP